MLGRSSIAFSQESGLEAAKHVNLPNLNKFLTKRLGLVGEILTIGRDHSANVGAKDGLDILFQKRFDKVRLKCLDHAVG